MKAKKWISLALAGVLSVSLAACGDSGPMVYVQPVSQLMDYGGIAPGDKFGGVVVSEHVAEVEKDGDRAIEELFVAEGDDVKEGDPLFTYDTEELSLTLDKQRLELEQMKASIETYKEQIKQLEKERNRVGGTDKLQFTVQIQTTEIDLKETELKIKTKEAEVKKSEDIMENATVTAPVTGRVQSIKEGGSGDQFGNPYGGQDSESNAYITIQKTGAYRVKGVISELQQGAISQGSRIKLTSRTDPSQVWRGTVSLVDYENPIKGSGYPGMGVEMGGASTDEMGAASRYPFYIKLDSTEGLLMGQHLYMELDGGDQKEFEVGLDGSFLVMEEEGKAYVWAENGRSKLEKRKVTLGEYDEMRNVYEITQGLSKDDYVAFPDPNLCKEGVRTSHDPVPMEEGGEMMPEGEMMPQDGIMPDSPDMGMLPEEEIISEEMPMEEMPAEEMPAEELPEEVMPEEAAPEASPEEAPADITEGGE